MSAKSLETTISELTKTVQTLGNRIISLEKVVLDQNLLIKKLVGVSGDSAKTTQIGANVGKSLTVNTGQLTQRPMRDARVRAETALSVNARKTKAARNVSPVVRTDRPEALEPNTSSSLSEPPTPTQPLPSDSPQLESVNTIAHTLLNDNNNDLLDWVEVKRKKTRRAPDNVTRGTAPAGSAVCALAAAERKSYLHLYYVQIGTTAEQVISHLRYICVDDKCSAEVLKSRGDYASFKLTVPTKNVEKYMKPEHWAEDVHIKPWRSGFRKSQL